jgi:NAD(P)-dependent dehydrogenase (short-subunit alcohol dehydrogenase family)
MLLENKVAVVFSAGGAVGGTVAREFAREGASVFLSGHRLESVKSTAQAIGPTEARVYVEQVDALNQDMVTEYLDGVVAQAGKIDVVFNAIGPASAGDLVMPSTEIPADTFLSYINTAVLSQFITARSAARHMLMRKSGVIVLMTATPAKGVAPMLAGHSAGHAAIEGLTRSLATEWGPAGIRVVAVRSAGMPDSPRIQEVFQTFAQATGTTREMFAQGAAERTLLKRMPTLPETARTICFLASDYARSLTGAIINASCGEVMD